MKYEREVLSKIFTSKEVKNKFDELNKSNFYRQLLYIMSDWCLIFGAIYLSRRFDNTFLYLVSVAIVAGRQHGLLVLMHDGAHLRFNRNRAVNDLISNFLCAFPFFISTQAYRVHHRNHHKFLNSEKDPDWFRKDKMPDWQFPKSKMQLFLVLIKQSFEGGFKWVYFTIKLSWVRLSAWQFTKTIILTLVVQITLFATFYFTLGFKGYLAYWLIPFLFIFPVFERIRGWSEHFGLPRKTLFDQSRVTEANWIESLFICPHNTRFHLTHHIFSSVPHYKLKLAHQEAFKISQDYRDGCHQNKSYLGLNRESVLTDFTKND